MPASLAQSRTDTIEEPDPDEDPKIVDVGPPAAQIVEEIISLLDALARRGPWSPLLSRRHG
jgi:ribose 5-phosphate isomerase A